MHTDILGVASGWGAKKRTSEQGPDTIRELLLNALKPLQAQAAWLETILPDISFANHPQPPIPADALPLLLPVVEKLAISVQKSLQNQHFPLVIGGDHANAVGTWSAVTAQKNAFGQFGLFWFDAHVDAHIPATSPSGAFHGMPVASLLGYGVDPLRNLVAPIAKIAPQHVVLYGVRSYESGEEMLLQQLGVRIYRMGEINQRGLDITLREALSHVAAAPKGWGISCDLDGFDPIDVPGVGSPTPDGIHPEPFMTALQAILPDLPAMTALEITEFNPPYDIGNQTASVLVRLVEIVLQNLHDKS